MKNYRFLSLCVIAALATVSGTYAQSIRWLGNLTSEGFSEATDVSENGDVVVGRSYASFTALPRAFRWTPQTGMQALTPRQGYTSAQAVNFDGTIVVGDDGARAFYWTESEGLQEIAPFVSLAWDVSAFSHVIVGRVNSSAFRWSGQTGLQILPTNTLNAYFAQASSVSADGAVVVGGLLNHDGYRVFRWTAQTGVQDLGTLPGYGSYSSTLEGRVKISDDGQVIVGAVYSPDQAVPYRAFRWTAQTGMQDLGGLDGDNFYLAYGVSGDGSVIVGQSGSNAVRWTEGGEAENLNLTYAHLLTDGSQLAAANAISLDGRYIVGYGFNFATLREEAYLLDTIGAPPCEGDANGDGTVDDADLLIVLFNFGSDEGEGDVNQDGIVDDADLLVVLFNFGNSC